MSEKTYTASVVVLNPSAVDKICDRYLGYGWKDEGPTQNEDGQMVLNFSSKRLLPTPSVQDINN